MHKKQWMVSIIAIFTVIFMLTGVAPAAEQMPGKGTMVTLRVPLNQPPPTPLVPAP